MVLIEKIHQLLDEYKNRIILVNALFIRKFGEKNPSAQWRKGIIDRTGFLDEQKSIQYSFHGAGCSIEFVNGEVISFDFDENDNYVTDNFKFGLFVETSSEDTKVKEKIEEYLENNKFIINRHLL